MTDLRRIARGGALWAGGALGGFALLNAGVLWIGLRTEAGDRATFHMVPWLLTAPGALVVATAALVETHRRVKRGVLRMVWRGISYRVNVRTGHVLEVVHLDPGAVAGSEAHQPAAASTDRHQPLPTE